MTTEIQPYADQGGPGTVETRSRGMDAIREAAAGMADAHALATAICKTSMVPDHFRGKPDECAAAILYGASLGFDPMQSVKAIYTVRGNAALYARSMDALVKAAGHETWTLEAGPEKVVMAGKRRGSNKVETAEWTIERAERAGYVPTIDPDTGKYRVNSNGKLIGNAKYLEDPETMLRAKATAEICRTIAPDVLNGVYSVEERQMEYVEAEVVTVKRPSGLAQALADSSPAPDGPESSAEPAPTPPTGQASAGEATPPESPLLNTSSGLAKTMYAAIRAAGIPKENVPEFLSEVTGRDITSSKELTEDEARTVLDHLPAQEGNEA